MHASSAIVRKSRARAPLHQQRSGGEVSLHVRAVAQTQPVDLPSDRVRSSALLLGKGAVSGAGRVRAEESRGRRVADRCGALRGNESPRTVPRRPRSRASQPALDPIAQGVPRDPEQACGSPLTLPLDVDRPNRLSLQESHACKRGGDDRFDVSLRRSVIFCRSGSRFGSVERDAEGACRHAPLRRRLDRHDARDPCGERRLRIGALRSCAVVAEGGHERDAHQIVAVVPPDAPPHRQPQRSVAGRFVKANPRDGVAAVVVDETEPAAHRDSSLRHEPFALLRRRSPTASSTNK